MEEGTDPEAYFREVFARSEDEPLPDLAAFPEELFIYESSPGAYFDAFPLLLMSQPSLRHFEHTVIAQGEGSQFDVRRFRPNIVVETTALGFPENDWVGRRGQIGSAVIKVEMECPLRDDDPRLQRPPHGFKNHAPLGEGKWWQSRRLFKHPKPGEITVGDSIHWLD